jgi:hypothetical protein
MIKNIRIILLFSGNLCLLLGVIYLLKYQLSKPSKPIETPEIIYSIVQDQAWKKINTIKIASKTAHALAVNSNGVLLVGDDRGITLYDKHGEKQATIALPGGITALTTDKETIYAALPRQIIKITSNKLTKWPKFNSRTLITAITTSGTTGVQKPGIAGVPPASLSSDVKSVNTPGTTGVQKPGAAGVSPANLITQASRLQKKHRRDAYATLVGNAGVPPVFLFIADAGNRKVYCYTAEGKKLWEIHGAENEKFIVPSPYFDLVPDGNGGIWVVNPGRHRIENYTAAGKFKALWEPLPAKTMLGCCNPAYLGVLSGDRFVTLEKGLVRSRLFAPSGKVIDKIVPANNFVQGRFKYDLAILPGDRVAILDSAGSKIDIYAQSKDR